MSRIHTPAIETATGGCDYCVAPHARLNYE